MPRDLTRKEVASQIGMSEEFVRRHMHFFPRAYRVGKRWRIPESDVERYREDRRQETRLPDKPRSKPALTRSHGAES